MPDAPDSSGTGVPQPRDPAERPATGTARAVSASASVPMPSRSAPREAEEVPPPAAAAQARVYGRPIQPVDDDEPRGDAAGPRYPKRRDHGPADVPPGRISGRASAGASAAPPDNRPMSPSEGSAPPDEPVPFGAEPGPFGGRARPPARPYADPPADGAGRGRANVPLRPEYYGELTTDISHRGAAPERSSGSAPAMPDWPPREPADTDPERPRMGGVFPGPATSAAAAPEQAGGWPPYTDAGQGPFDRFGADQQPPDPFQTEQPNRFSSKSGRSESGHIRMLPVLLSVAIGALLLVGIAIGIVWLISRGSDSSFNVGAGDCVKRSGNAAVKASCNDADAYKVVSIADTKDQCADKRQPYVLNPTKDGKTQVLCLKPSGR